ncbi:MAG TPA: hypothetical protein PKJ27_10675, partial [Bacteroidales bacterium]|nr:hypothetical protein [Bacteroidales bacterium]
SSIAPLKYFILKVASLKYLYMALIVLCLLAAFLYNQFSGKVYEVTASLSPIEDKTSTILSSNELFAGFRSLESLNNIENDITNLSSFELVYKTVNSMNLEVSYFSEFKKILTQTTELYGNTPFTVTIDKSHIQPIDAKFRVSILDDASYRLTLSQKKVSFYNYVDNLIVSEDNTIEFDTICRFNDLVSNKLFRFSIALNKNFPRQVQAEYSYYFKLNHLDLLSKQYLKKLEIEKASPLASIINVTFAENNLDKTITFLNRYLNTFLDENLTKKNNMAAKTVSFIDSQISDISDSLVISESQLRNYRSTNQVMDLSFQGQRVFDQMQEIENERANLQIQERYYNYVINYLNLNDDISGLSLPSAMNVNDPIITQLISNLNELTEQRSSLLAGSNPQKNIFIKQLDDRINFQRQIILENFTNNLNTLTLSLNELDYRQNKLSREASSLP